MCVQPMKVLAAVAIARPFTLHETMAAGIGVGAIVGGLSAIGLVELASRFVPRPVVKGIQLGAGLTLIINAGTTLLKLEWAEKWNDNLLWAMGMLVILYATSRIHHFPFALLIFILGIIFAIIVLAPQRKLPRGGIYRPHTTVPTASDFRVGILSASLSQVPLTLLNSVLAVTALSAELLSDRPVPSNTSLGLSVAAMNLFGCWFGAMPLCHGSGGYVFSSLYHCGLCYGT
jgi:MFS superfamily sulfate permease-like transporter